MMLLSLCLLLVLTSSVFVMSCLYCSHQIRFRDGYDSELETDYQELVKQYGK
ncbi:hypothetical protein [Streptococcus agalactiae]|uniref:hypothetical protein n=1 Tax=Streptococcus agalactiae TaxID=1311 RepID=UPI001D00D1F7|nr:hypothetical protein [Streptococcus agalactiae]